MHLKRQSFSHCYFQEPVYWMVNNVTVVVGCIGQSNRFVQRYKLSRLGPTVWINFRPLTIQVHSFTFFCYSHYTPIITRRWFEKKKKKKKKKRYPRITQVKFSSLTTIIASNDKLWRIRTLPASFLYKSIVGRYRPLSCPDGPITAHYRFL